MSDTSKLVMSTQEQAVAAWVNHLNQLRLDSLLSRLADQGENLKDALATVEAAMRTINVEVVTRNRGGIKGMHGFIAEVAETGIQNARARVLGNEAIYEWVNDNGPADLLREGVEVQQKFVAAGGRFGLRAVAEHLEKYPDFVQNGGRYQIPADHYETIRALYDMRPADASKLVRGGPEGWSLKDWQRVQAFFESGEVGIDALEPSSLDYGDAQRGAYAKTFATEEESLRATDRSLREEALQASRATLREGAKATIMAGAVEGGTSFVMAVLRKRRAGTPLKDFTSGDWTEILGESGWGLVKGSVRGASLYSLTNSTATPAAVASSLVTAAFGIAEQAHKFRSGDLSEVEFIENAELLSVEAAVSALSSFVGQAVIPIPVLGAVIGNAVGAVMYRAASDALAEQEADLLAGYANEQRVLDEQLSVEHQELLERIRVSTSTYISLLERAFSPDIHNAVQGSVALAEHVGVAPELVLDTDRKTRTYFLD